jgi:hypothetical protein
LALIVARVHFEIVIQRGVYDVKVPVIVTDQWRCSEAAIREIVHRPIQPPIQCECAGFGVQAIEPAERDLAARRAGGEALIRERLKRAKREGDLPEDADPAALARFVTTVMQGMAVQAAGGASRKQLRAIADTALKAWPS